MAGLGALGYAAAVPWSIASAPPVYRMMNSMMAFPKYVMSAPRYFTGAAAPPAQVNPPYAIKQDEEKHSEERATY